MWPTTVEFLNFTLEVALSNLLGAVRPKHRVYTKFAHFVDENDKVVTENLTKRFVDHRRLRLASQTVAKFPLHHAERRFDIGALVVVQ